MVLLGYGGEWSVKCVKCHDSSLCVLFFQFPILRRRLPIWPRTVGFRDMIFSDLPALLNFSKSSFKTEFSKKSKLMTRRMTEDPRKILKR